MNKKKWIILGLGVLIIIILFVVLSIVTKKEETNDTNYTIKDVKVTTQTLENSITGSGEISSTSVTKYLNTDYYFSKILVSKNAYIKKGTKIIKYTNGTYYKAPYNLVITETSLPDSGDRVRSNNYIVFQSVASLNMYLTIDESEIDKVSVGQEVTITPSAYEDKTYTGKITFINQIGSYSSSGSTYTATVSFTNDGSLKLGMSAVASVTIEKKEDVITVPIEAIQTKGDSKYVIVVTGDETKEVTVETGISNDAYVEITSGLTGDETVRMMEVTSTTSSNRFGNNMPSDFMPEMGNSENRSGMSRGTPKERSN